MQEILSRLRAARIPQAAAIFAALLLIYWLSGVESDNALERRISKTLSLVDGAGRVEVTIAMKTAGEVQRTLGKEQNRRTPCGAVAVAQGADDPLVALELQEALCALLSLPPSSVAIMTGGR